MNQSQKLILTKNGALSSIEILMNNPDVAELKHKVHDYWSKQACGTFASQRAKFTREYFDEIEAYRYRLEPEIFSFAQFTRFHGCRVLEVGIGAGTDFLQWVRAGAKVSGIDLTQEGVDHVRERLGIYGLAAEDVKVADCETVPYPENTFDLVYSWGVIHHTPNTEKALSEIVRVCRPGSRCKIMVYHRHSLQAFYVWLRYGLLKLRPFRSLSWCLFHHMESIGTKAYTRAEMAGMLSNLPVNGIRVSTVLTHYDRLGEYGPLARSVARALAWLLGGNRVGWFMLVEFTKNGQHAENRTASSV